MRLLRSNSKNEVLESQHNAESLCLGECLKAGSPRAIRDIVKADDQSAEDFKGFSCFLPNSTADHSPLPPAQKLQYFNEN